MRIIKFLIALVIGTAYAQTPSPSLILTVPNTDGVRNGCTNANGCPPGAPIFSQGVTEATNDLGNSPSLLFLPGVGGKCSFDDGVTCVNSRNGQRFVSRYSGAANILWFGSHCDGVTDDTSIIQTAINDIPDGSTLSLEGLLCGITGITISHPITLDGGMSAGTNSTPPSHNATGGFNNLLTNNDLITLASGADQTHIKNLWGDMNFSGNSHTGHFIYASAFQINDIIENVATTGACGGISMTGNNDYIDLATLNHSHGDGNGSGCNGFSYGDVGHAVGIITTRSFAIGTGPTAANTINDGFRVVDCGGCLFYSSQSVFTTHGLAIVPQSGQNVPVTAWYGGVPGDTTTSSNIYVAPGAGGSVGFLYVEGASISSSSTTSIFGGPQVDPEIELDATNGPITDYWFVNNIVHAGVSSVRFDGSGSSVLQGGHFVGNHLCGAGSGMGAGTYYPVDFEGTSTHIVEFKGNIIGAGSVCDGQVSGGGTTAFHFNSSIYGLDIEGNNLLPNSLAYWDGSDPTFVGVQSNIIKNNQGPNAFTPSIASAATIEPLEYEEITVTGTVSVTTINGCWPGRLLGLKGTSATPFATGGNIAAAFTLTPNVHAVARCLFTSGATGGPLWYITNG